MIDKIVFDIVGGAFKDTRSVNPQSQLKLRFFHKMIKVDRKHCSALKNYWISMKLGNLVY